MNLPALSVRKLTVSVRENGQQRPVVDGIGFDLGAGEVLAVVGESGCGKSKTAEAIMGLVSRETGSVSAETLMLGDTDLATLGEGGMQGIRGREISMVFQEPLTALDPVFNCGHQLATIYRRHRGQSRRTALESACRMFSRVGFPDPDRVMRSYPHKLSGGMRQRVIIAMAMACRGSKALSSASVPIASPSTSGRPSSFASAVATRRSRLNIEMPLASRSSNTCM